MIWFFKFRRNDLNPSFGKQIEFTNPERINEFFEIEGSTKTVYFTYRSLGDNDPLNGTRIKVKLSLSPARGDYKIYSNDDGSQSLKEFLLNSLHLSSQNNSDDYFALYKINSSEYYFYYIPKSTDFASLYSKIRIKDDFVSFNNMQVEIPEDAKENVLKYLAAIRTKPFILLAGISGTGKSRIVRKLAQATVPEDLQRLYDPKSVINGLDRWNLHKPANFELIQVKPNWHNSMEVIGYKSNIGGIHYEFTPFIEFVARAWQHQDVPFFLCLDEMNLAPVEQYFAEFLSAIESRTLENGVYMTDPIIKPFESFDTKDSQGQITDCLSDRMIAKLIGALDTQEKSDLAEQFRTKGLTLPKNLIVMGTVNMDETTFSFSRKVLDRAMSIVMNEVDLEAYFNHQSDVINTELSDKIKNALIDRPISGLEVNEALGEDAGEVRNFFDAINKKLEGTPFKLGYRAISEALLYASAAKVFGSESIKDTLDQFTLMKILSRIEGDKRSIGSLLTDLTEVISGDYVKSHKKLEQMSETLERSQFVSYWT